ncbi:hypothetical protein [Flindersiella endophytica]
MSWSSTFTNDIVLSFTMFCQDRFPPSGWMEGSGRPNSLLEYIGAWLFADEGARITCGSYEAYLQAILIIIDAYDKDPSIINFHGNGSGSPPTELRTVTRLLDLHDQGDTFLDVHVYRKAVAGLEF